MKNVYDIGGSPGSTNFNSANSFAHAVEKLDEKLSALMNDEQAYLIILAVLRAASWQAHGSQGLRNTKFGAIPHIKVKAIKFMSENELLAESLLDQEKSLDMNIADLNSEYLSDEIEA